MSDEILISQLKHPLTGSEAPVVDARAEFARMAAAHPIDPIHRAGFIAARRRRAEASPHLSPDEKAAWLARFNAARPSEGPAPDATVSGVGFGFDYQHAFNVNYANGTAITFQVICPNMPGGNVQNNLYLTATNRTTRGLEVYINYFGANNLGLLSVYDWSLGVTSVQAGFVMSIFFPNLGRYFIPLSTHGQIVQTLYVHNVTFQIANAKWTNQGMLFNLAAQTWDLIYSSTYKAALADQQAVGFLGSWGPIIETHEAPGFIYSGTNTMGFMQSQVSITDGAGTPVNLILLDPSNTIQRGPTSGYQVSFLNPNYDWAAFS